MLKVNVCICLNLNAAARDCHTIFCNLPQLLQTVFLVTKRKKSQALKIVWSEKVNYQACWLSWARKQFRVGLKHCPKSLVCNMLSIGSVMLCQESCHEICSPQTPHLNSSESFLRWPEYCFLGMPSKRDPLYILQKNATKPQCQWSPRRPEIGPNLHQNSDLQKSSPPRIRCDPTWRPNMQPRADRKTKMTGSWVVGLFGAQQ